MSSPFYMPAGYNNPYGQSIAELMLRKGDVGSQNAQMWGNLAANVASAAGQYMGQRYENQQQQKRSAMVDQAINTWDWNDPRPSIALLQKAVGPEKTKEIIGGLTAAQTQTEKLAKGQQLSFDDFAKQVSTLDTLEKARPGFIQQNYQEIRKQLAPAVEAHIPGYSLPPEFTPEVQADVHAFGQQFAKPKNAAVPHTKDVPQPDGTVRTFQWDPQGATWMEAPGLPAGAREAKPPTTKDIGGRVKQFNPQTGQFDIDLGASEGTLNRAAAAETRAVATAQKEADEAEKKAEKAAGAAEARKANDDSVSAAFGAMKAALKNVEAYSGTAAITSPLEAANARQQYDAAASAFAATLSRATGDTRISDKDRAAYAGLMTYMGPGSSIIKITRPDLTRKRLEEAEKFFDEAATARDQRLGTFGAGEVKVDKNAFFKKNRI